MTYREGPLPVAPETGPYHQLAAWAKAHEVPYGGAAQVSAEVDRRRVTLSLRIDSGVVRGVVAEVHVGSFPEVVLRAETSDDVHGKDRGIAVEAQTGDAAFDARVYVETDLAPEAVLPMLSPEVRAATLALLDMGSDVVAWRKGDVVVHLDEGARGEAVYAPAVLDALLRHALVLAGAPPAAAREASPAARAAERFSSVMVLAAVAGFVLMIVALVRYPPVQVAPVVVAAVAGFLGALLFPVVAKRYTRGAARSHTSYALSVGAALVALPTLAVALLVGINGLFDAAPEQARGGTVTAVGDQDSDNSTWSVDVRWTDGETGSASLPEAPRPTVGAAVWRSEHPGALGLRWYGDTALR